MVDCSHQCKGKISQCKQKTKKYCCKSHRGTNYYTIFCLGFWWPGNLLSLYFEFLILTVCFVLQEIFYSTHQFFISQRSVYLIVFSLVKVDDERIEYWLKAIRSGIVFYVVDTCILSLYRCEKSSNINSGNSFGPSKTETRTLCGSMCLTYTNTKLFLNNVTDSS